MENLIKKRKRTAIYGITASILLFLFGVYLDSLFFIFIAIMSISLHLICVISNNKL